MRNGSHGMGVEAPALLVRVVDIIQILSDAGQDLTIAEISERVGIPQSTTYRLVGYLSEFRILSPRTEPGMYGLGPKLLEWGSRMQQSLNVRREAIPIMEGLRDRFSETVHLSIRDELDGIPIELVETRESLRQHIEVGQRVPLHAGASMRVLLAFAPERVVDRCLTVERMTRVGPGTVTDHDEMRKILGEVRSRGFALSAGELYPEAMAISVPVFGPIDEIVASLSISGPAVRWSSASALGSLPELREAADQLSTKLGSRRSPSWVEEVTGP